MNTIKLINDSTLYRGFRQKHIYSYDIFQSIWETSKFEFSIVTLNEKLKYLNKKHNMLIFITYNMLQLI